MSSARLTVGLAAFALVLAGCGGSDVETGATTTPAPRTPGTAVEESDQARLDTNDQGALGRIVADLFGMSPEEFLALSEEEGEALFASLQAEDLSAEQQLGVAYVFSVVIVALPVGLGGQEQCSDRDAIVDELAPGILEELRRPIPELDGMSMADALGLTTEEVYADLDLVVDEACDDLAEAEGS